MKVELSNKRNTYMEPTVERMKPRTKPTIWNTRKEKAFNENT